MPESLFLFIVFVATPVLVLVLSAGAPTLAHIQGLGALYGIGGALLLAVPGVAPAWGFTAFLVSNVAWLLFGGAKRLWGLVLQQSVFLVASLVGIWNWWLGPLLLG